MCLINEIEKRILKMLFNIVYRAKNSKTNKLFQCVAKNERKAKRQFNKHIGTLELEFFTFCTEENIDCYMNGLYYSI